MDTNTQNEMSMNSAPAGPTGSVEDTMTNETTSLADANGELTPENAEGAEHDPNHPHHHNNSALRAASMGHSAVHHVMPHHRTLDL